MMVLSSQGAAHGHLCKKSNRTDDKVQRTETIMSPHRAVLFVCYLWNKKGFTPPELMGFCSDLL